VGEQVGLALQDLRVRQRLDDATVDHQVVPIGDARREAEVLLDE
jgi:hypothetical protein